MTDTILTVIGAVLFILIVHLFATAVGEKAAEWYDRRRDEDT